MACFYSGVGGHDCTDSRTGIGYPHHNRTVLRFFNDALAATSEHAREFMVVGKDDGLSDSCPALSVQFSLEKIAGGSGHRESKANRQQRFSSTVSSIPHCGWLC
ncbi:TDP-N-acetylfucosamine:lipid II N-acetylfucosaminyltransferase [Escherichia coli]|nr:TDP-N-acetylfucosamine:lipid II N-acetylfucosaminyltransferase [Escherichia coli]